MGIIRKTKSITVLLAEFEKSSDAISATDLIKRLHSKMNKTTVYRLLDKLEDDDVVHSFLDSKGQKWYGKGKKCSHKDNLERHPHFECLSCGKVECLDLDVDIPEIPRREVKTFQILVQGRCETCLVESETTV